MTKFPVRTPSRRSVLRAAAIGGMVLASPAILRVARAADKLKIGVLLPRSGFFAAAGQACQRGCDLAAQILNAQGYSVELMNADFESSADIARTQAEKLIREGANILIGCFESGATNAMAQVCEQRGIPCIVNIGADPKITEQGYKFLFRNFPTSPMLVTNGLKAMGDLFTASGTTPKTAVLMHANDTFGQSMLGAITALGPKVGLPFKIVDTIAYDPKARDLSIEVTKAKAANAELHMVVTRSTDAILMVREMVKQKYEPMGIVSPGSPGMYDGQFYKTLGKYSDYCITNIAWMNPKQELENTLAAEYAKAYPNEDYELNIGFSFEAILIAADAFKRAGASASPALVEALRATNISRRVMIGGAIKFDEKGQNVDQAVAAVQNRGGKAVVILPTDVAAQKPVFPMPGWAQRT